MVVATHIVAWMRVTGGRLLYQSAGLSPNVRTPRGGILTGEVRNQQHFATRVSFRRDAPVFWQAAL